MRWAGAAHPGTGCSYIFSRSFIQAAGGAPQHCAHSDHKTFPSVTCWLGHSRSRCCQKRRTTRWKFNENSWQRFCPFYGTVTRCSSRLAHGGQPQQSNCTTANKSSSEFFMLHYTAHKELRKVIVK